jgi:hypothetical protein
MLDVTEGRYAFYAPPVRLDLPVYETPGLLDRLLGRWPVEDAAPALVPLFRRAARARARD